MLLFQKPKMVNFYFRWFERLVSLIKQLYPNLLFCGQTTDIESCVVILSRCAAPRPSSYIRYLFQENYNFLKNT